MWRSVRANIAPLDIRNRWKIIGFKGRQVSSRRPRISGTACLSTGPAFGRPSRFHRLQRLWVLLQHFHTQLKAHGAVQRVSIVCLCAPGQAITLPTPILLPAAWNGAPQMEHALSLALDDLRAAPRSPFPILPTQPALLSLLWFLCV